MLLVLGVGAGQGVVEEELAEALHRQHREAPLAVLHQVRQPRHRLDSRDRGYEKYLSFDLYFHLVGALSLQNVEEEVRLAGAAEEVADLVVGVQLLQPV